MFLKVPEGFQRKFFSSCADTLLLPLMCQETIGAQAKQWKVLTNRATVKEKYKGAQGFLERMRSLVEDVSECVESTDNAS